jgi:glycosyltransferase involved in cell wall biosynthesis
MQHLDSRLILYSPNIHTGGGLVLLQEVLEANGTLIKHAFIAKRAKDKLQFPAGASLDLVGKSFFSRFFAEWKLKKLSAPQDTILCFHGLPPLLALPGKVVVFAQNRLLFERSSLREYRIKTRLRIHLERLFVRIKHRPSIRYIVQTLSMASSLKQLLGKECQVSIVPFSAHHIPSEAKSAAKNYDFLYVANGEPHKNHLKLIEAWKILSEQGIKPSLALTIDSQVFATLVEILEHQKRTYDLKITNLGGLPHNTVLNLYGSSGALVYPSKIESLGLPLIEAFQAGLPILASEKDYVRDTVSPRESFDPESALSIARAVKRFLGSSEPLLRIGSTADFLKEVIK